MKEKICGIYKITNQINGKVYIGQSIDIKDRWQEHKREAFKQDSYKYNYPLYQAIRKYGLENFTFEILEECLFEELNQKEIEYISLYESYPPDNGKGYNQNPGGGGGTPYKNRPYKDKDNLNAVKDYLINTKLSQKEISKILNVCVSTISYINKGKIAFDKNLKYPIRYYNSTSNLNYNKFENSLIKRVGRVCSICGSKIQYLSTTCKKCSRLSIKIPIPSKEEILKAFYELKNCQKVADKFNVSTVLLKKWREELDLPEKVKDTIELYQREYLEIVRKEKFKRQPKKIVQISLETKEILNVFNNAAEAGRYLNKYVFNQTGNLNTPRRSDSILNCCKGEIKSSYGFKWEFIQALQ